MSIKISCAISKIGISENNPIVYIPLCKSDNLSYRFKNKKDFFIDSHELYQPVCFPIFGSYTGQGEIKDIEINENTKFIEEKMGYNIYSIANSNNILDMLIFGEIKNIIGGMFIKREIYEYIIKKAHILEDDGLYPVMNGQFTNERTIQLNLYKEYKEKKSEAYFPFRYLFYKYSEIFSKLYKDKCMSFKFKEELIDFYIFDLFIEKLGCLYIPSISNYNCFMMTEFYNECQNINNEKIMRIMSHKEKY